MVMLEELMKKFQVYALDFQLMISGKLELSLCNEVHRAALLDRFFELRKNENCESFYAFAQKLRSAALALPN